MNVTPSATAGLVPKTAIRPATLAAAISAFFIIRIFILHPHIKRQLNDWPGTPAWRV